MAFLWHCCENLPLESLFWRVFACLTLHFHWLRVTLDNHSQTVWLHVLGKECVRVRFTTLPPSLTWCISYPAPFLSFFLSLSFGTDRNRSLSRWGFEEGLTHSGKGGEVWQESNKCSAWKSCIVPLRGETVPRSAAVSTQLITLERL